MSTIIGLCGSLRRGSFNLMLLRAAAEAAPAGTSLEIASIREMETGTSHVPAIALTARTRPEDVELALASGFQLHLAKPIDSRRLVESIATLMVRT